ncbi:MAG: cytochrome P450, partial [Proteobacteria bacterium]|nr:cytochrome P450 [Pseudomonadota bacterium]
MGDFTDVSDPQLYQDDAWHEPFARLRREDAVHRHPDSPYGPYWSITRHADIMKVELDPGTFSSAQEWGGIQIADQPRNAGLPNFIRMDPPRHTEQRRTVAPIVAPSNLANMEGLIRGRTAQVLDGLPRGEPFDWVDRVSTELTALMLATLFDFPQADRRKLTHWSDVAIANVADKDAVVKSEAERMTELRHMGEVMAALWSERAAQPPKFDLISMMAHAPATQNMPLNEFIGTFGLLIVGGNDTTRNSMTGGLMALAENPGELARVRADRSLIPALVSEIIRWQTPVIHMRRTATRDVEVAGKPIARGDKVVMWYVSGNRDEG